MAWSLHWALAFSLALHTGFFVLITRSSLFAPPASPEERLLTISLEDANASAESLLIDETELSHEPPESALSMMMMMPPEVTVTPSMSMAAAESFPSPAALHTAAPSPVVVAKLVVASTGSSEKPPISASSAKSSRRTRSRASLPGASSGSQHGSTAKSGEGNAGGDSMGEAGYVPPQFRLRYKPIYPPAARAKHLEGTVLLLINVNSEGRVTHAEIHRSCGYLILDQTALEAVRSWRFEPAQQNGVAIAARVEVPVRFRIGDS